MLIEPDLNGIQIVLGRSDALLLVQILREFAAERAESEDAEDVVLSYAIATGVTGKLR